jgi:hypothetical protein
MELTWLCMCRLQPLLDIEIERVTSVRTFLRPVASKVNLPMLLLDGKVQLMMFEFSKMLNRIMASLRLQESIGSPMLDIRIERTSLYHIVEFGTT